VASLGEALAGMLEEDSSLQLADADRSVRPSRPRSRRRSTSMALARPWMRALGGAAQRGRNGNLLACKSSLRQNAMGFEKFDCVER